MTTHPLHTEEHYYRSMAEFGVPEHTQSPLVNYLEHRIAPGGFLTAVLCNDLKEAMGRADVINRAHMFEIVSWLYNRAPGNAWGSPENVKAWLAEGGTQ